MKGNLGRILFYLIMLAVQIVLSDHVNIGPYIYLCCLPLLVLSLPLYQDTAVSMVLAFLLGLVVDILCDGIIGLNAAAAVALAAVRKPLYAAFFSKDSLERAYIPTMQETGFIRHFNFILASVVVYFLVYICLDSAGMESLQTTLLRLLLSCVSNAAVILLLDYSLFNSQK